MRIYSFPREARLCNARQGKLERRPATEVPNAQSLPPYLQPCTRTARAKASLQGCLPSGRDRRRSQTRSSPSHVGKTPPGQLGRRRCDQASVTSDNYPTTYWSTCPVHSSSHNFANSAERFAPGLAHSSVPFVSSRSATGGLLLSQRLNVDGFGCPNTLLVFFPP